MLSPSPQDHRGAAIDVVTEGEGGWRRGGVLCRAGEAAWKISGAVEVSRIGVLACSTPGLERHTDLPGLQLEETCLA
jgi:hypothetical protein